MLTPHRRLSAGIAGVAAVTLAVTGCSSEHHVGAVEPDLSAIADQIAAYAEDAAQEREVPAIAIGIITEDGLVEERFVGENASGDPLTADTLFEIGSSTKAFLGVTEAILVDRGELKWEDRVIDHAPDFRMSDPWVTNEFQIEDLLAQRSGLSEYASELPNVFGAPWAENAKGLQYLEPTTSFRSTFAYQNIPHQFAGDIVARAEGAADWNSAVVGMLLEPLGMLSTTADRNGLEQSTDSTRGHTMLDGALLERPIEDFPSNAQGAGSLISNLTDMSKWIGFHLSQGNVDGTQVVSPEQLQRTYTPLVPIADEHFVNLAGFGEGIDSMSYGTGWFIHSLPEGRVIEHGGNTLGYNSAVMFDPDRKLGLLVLTNQGFDGGAGSHIGKYGMDLLQHREPLDYLARDTRQKADAAQTAEKDQGAAPDPHPLEVYTGVYDHELLGALDITVDGDTLRTRVGVDQRDGTLTHDFGHQFRLSWMPREDSVTPETEVVVFDGEHEQPEHLNMSGFEFTRAG